VRALNGRGESVRPQSMIGQNNLVMSSERAKYRQPQIRQVVINGQTFAAVSAHELLEATDEAARARPGHPFG